ncbi:MAG: hypothetical protein AAF716_20145 [Cyanobacteria bacterium P01_D01_bin.1]
MPSSTPSHQSVQRRAAEALSASLATRPPLAIVLLSAGYCAFFLVMLVVAYTGHLPVSELSKIHNFDKVGHLILYCIPTYLGHRLCRGRHIRRVIPVFPSLFTLFTIVEELIQGLSPNRTLDAGDMLCSLIGIGVGYWLAQCQIRRNVKQAAR